MSNTESLITFSRQNGFLVLASPGRTVPILVSANELPAVLRAAQDLRNDFGRVTGFPAEIYDGQKFTAQVEEKKTVILVGTVGKSDIIDQLSASKKIDSTRFAGLSEAYLIQTVNDPLPGIETALVIAGSDRRGTIYGLYEISRQIGVSPWYWWLDAPIEKREALYANPECVLFASPGVRYRGIFLNDEYPALTKWIKAKFGDVTPSEDPPIPPNIANYGREFYTRLFELLLRLKANYLWPAMWNNAFNEDDGESKYLAESYGIVMGTSHQEPMLRAQKEWDRRYENTIGKWNYATHPEVLEDFWKKGIERNKELESIITIGLRGPNDTEMAPGGPEANRALLEHIVERQRAIISESIGRRAEEVPQLWCLYKEMQEFYNSGMRVPDDVTLLWSDDNWGNQRRLPTPEERKRKGGAGIYYHFDYHGGPRSYQWINTSAISKIWDQMSLARQYGADRIWIVNVGHFRGYEYPISFFMDLAWNPEGFSGDSIKDYTRPWIEQFLPPDLSAEASDILETCTRYNSRVKPELLSPDTWSAVNYREAETIVGDWYALEKRALHLSNSIKENAWGPFYQLILFPVRSSAILADLYASAGKNQVWAAQGRTAANSQEARVHALFAKFMELVNDYNDNFAGGKWQHFMDQPVLGYMSWADPPQNNIDHIRLTRLEPSLSALMGIAVEGCITAWPQADRSVTPVLPCIDSLNDARRWVEIFNKGTQEFSYTAMASEPWIQISKPKGLVKEIERIEVWADWTKAPTGESEGTVLIEGTGKAVSIIIKAFNVDTNPLRNYKGFIETDRVLTAEAEHFSKNTPFQDRAWIPVGGYGKTLSGMRATAEANPPMLYPGKTSPCLEYSACFYHTGEAKIILDLSPVLNFIPDRDVLIGVSLDNDTIETITIIPANYAVTNENDDWGNSVCEGRRRVISPRTIKTTGEHIIKIWMISPGIVLERVTVDLGGLRPSFLGPNESYRYGT